ncbi:MAG: glycosyl transferase family 36 [Planctomycetota bacterium]
MTIKSTYGQFTDEGFSYTIQGTTTPRPWSNVVCNGRYGFVVSNNGGGFSWLDNSQLNVLTRWDMDLIEDRTGKHLFLRDLDEGLTWSAAPAPCRPEYDAFTCRHAPGSTTFNASIHGIDTAWCMTVADDAQVEVWTLEIRNTSNRVRRLRVGSYLEWCCGVAPDVKREFHKLFIGSEYDADRSVMTARKVMWDVPDRTEKDHWNRGWPYVAAHAVVGHGFDAPLAFGDKERIVGNGRREDPQALRDGGTDLESFGRFTDAAAMLGGDLTLQPGETRRVAFLLAIGDDAVCMNADLERYRSIDAAFGVAAKTEQGWRDRLSPTTVRTSMTDFDVMNNTWLRYQAISARLWGRTGYYQQSGAFGFRDQLQDSQVWLPIDPDRCREQILLHAHQQFNDGSVYHWWHPLTNDGNHTSCSDDYLWLPFLVCSYIKETGDDSILDEVTPFVDGGEATLAEHCDLSIRRSFSRTSDRGLPLIGAMDWNDGLSSCGIDNRGESVWLSFFLSGILRDYAEVVASRGQAEWAAELLAKRQDYVAAANEHAWDGSWYRRATNDAGTWLGASDCESGRIFLNPQTWAILTESGPSDRLSAAWDSVREHLLRDMGPLLLAPAYSVPDREVGYITRYTPGSRENGGVYMHAAVWALAAACKQKDQKAATSIWHSFSPPRRGEDSDAYRAEPYVTPGNIDGPDSATPGAAGWTWYTGSAAWLHHVSLTHVLGIRPVFGGLEIDPCPIEGMGEVSVERAWRGRRIIVSFDASRFTIVGKPQLTVNGAPHEGNTITAEQLETLGGTIEVGVTWSLQAASQVEPRPMDSQGATL